ncbi:MAG: YciI family protein [Pseudomonadota bacterium]
MRFMIIRKADHNTEAGTPPSAALLAAMEKYGAQLEAAGLSCAGQGLQPSAEGVRITFSDGKINLRAGPFPEEKQLVAGFIMMEAQSREEAIEWLRRWPAEDGDGELTLEIRGGGCPGGLEGIGLTKEAANSASMDSGADQAQRYMVMLKTNAQAEAGAIPSDAVLAAMARRNEEGIRAGVLVAAEGLQTSASGARVKFFSGKSTVLDGPFSETKELIAGYWLLQGKSIEDAIAWVKSYPYPFIDDAEVEIRPVL